jgi:hypothetical protein
MSNEPRKISFRDKSSDIDNLTYYVDQKRLVIEFKKGRTYEYSPVNGELYHGLFLAPSLGKFVRENIIKNKDIIAKQVPTGEYNPGAITPEETV